MTDVLILCIVLIVLCFGLVVLRGAPYLPTLRRQQEEALGLLDLQTGQTLLELGCGDGRVLVAAAKRGCNAVGYELNPLLALVAWARTRKYRGRVQVVCGDFWDKEWPRSDAIFTFLLPRYMKKLDKKIIQYMHKPVKLASIAFTVPARKAAAQTTGVYLYIYDK